jgi:FkbM family methyltransferase
MTRLIRLLYPYGSERRVLRGPARGMRFVVEPGIGLSYAIGAELAAPRYFRQHLRPGMTVFDVGANKGQMTLLFAALVGPSGRIASFEPAPSEFRSLERNLALNALTNVRTFQAAAADAERDLTFMYDPANPTQGKLHDVERTYSVAGARPQSVPAIRLDSVLDGAGSGAGLRPDLIKIDVEGAAASVLRGATRILEEVGPRLFLELHGPEEQAGIRDELLTRGYVAETLDGTRVADPTVGWNSPLWCFKPGS